MSFSRHDRRSAGSKPGTSGLHAPNLQEERKRENSCSEDAQLKRQKKIDRKRTRSDDEESEPGDHLTKKLKMREKYTASGLKSSLHGGAYQLKLLMLFLKRGIDQGYQFRLATEMDAAEKFDDLVFQYKDGEKITHRFLQAKHKQDETDKISINDLLTDTDKKLSLQKYFLSYRKIKRNPEFNGMDNEIGDMIICTNIGFKLGDKRRALTLCDSIFRTKSDETILKTDLLRFKKNFIGKEEIVSVLEYAPDLMELAKYLADRLLDNECTKTSKAEKKKRDDCLELYRSALLKEVIDGDSKKLRSEFIKLEQSLSPEAKNFREAFEKVFRDRRRTYNLHTDPVIKDLDEFAQEVAALIEEGKGCKTIKIHKRKEVIKENFDKLAGYVLVKVAGKTKFSSAFLDKDKLPGNLDDFRKKLLTELLKKNITPNDIADSTFQVYKDFQSCDEIYVNMNTFWKVIGERKLDPSDNFCKWDANLESVDKLPSDTIADIDKEIDDFFDKLLFAVNQPNEISLSHIISQKMGNCRGLNLMTTELQASSFQKYVFDWMKEKNGRFLTCADGKAFFDKMGKEITTLQLSWLTRAYFSRMKKRDIRFTKYDEELQNFLKPENKSQLFILTSMPDTIFGLIQVHQIIKEMSDYQKDDSYIIIRWDSFLDTQDLIVDAFRSQSKRFQCNVSIKPLLIIECKSIKVFERISDKNLDAMKLNDGGKIILITEKNDELVAQFRRMFDGKFVEKKVEVNSLLDLDNKSRDKIIEGRTVKFQGQEVYLCELLINEKWMNLINSEALAKLINNETLEIGRPLEDLGDVEHYYISRTFKRWEKINPSFCDDKSGFYVTDNNQLTDSDLRRHQDIVVISDNNKFFEQLRHNENYCKHNIHWLKSENGQFIWQDSNGTVSNLRKFADRDSVKLFIPEKVTDISNKIVIIAAEPGMGKSTVLTHLSVQTKRSEPTLWVAKINLSVDCSKALAKMVKCGIKFDDGKTIDFLLASAELTSEMPEYAFFKHCYETENMILLFDGFDEIIPDYTNKVIELLTFLKDKKVKKIWVTTRPYNIKSILEDKLGSFSYVLEEFSEKDQRCFLLDFLKSKLNSDKFDDQRVNDFIDTLLNSFSKLINDDQRKFISIPLQIRMIADVCENIFRNFIESNDENIADLEKKLGVNLELVSLYKKFLEIKFEDIDFVEKEPSSDSTNPRTKDRLERDRKYVVETHEILALENLYPKNVLISRKKVDNLLKNVKKGKNRTGIIDRVVNDQPVFVHKSFAEYFAAVWFSKNWPKENVKQFLKERIFNEESKVIRNFFDRMLANNELETSESQESSTEHPECVDVCKLHEAVLNNDGREVEKLLDDDESLFYKTDAAGRNLLHLAASRRHEEIARSFLEAVQERMDDTDVIRLLSVKDELFQWSPLTYADRCQHWNVAELFLQKGAAGEDMFEAIAEVERNLLEFNSETLLHTAAKEGYLKIAELLLDKGITINFRDGLGRTPLHLAARAGHLGMLQYFTNQQDADLEAADEFGRTVLHMAASNGNLEVMKYLVDEKNANFEAAEKPGDTVLHIAAKHGNLEVVKYLVDEKNANFEAANESGDTVLYEAASRGNLEVVKYLVDEKNARLEAGDESGCTVLYEAASSGNLEVVKYLVDEKNAKLEAADETGCTVLHMAATHGNLEVVKYLVEEKKANFEAVNESGNTVLHRAALYGHLEVVKYLIDEKNANFEAADESGCTVLHKAAYSENWEVVKYLVDEKNANFEASDKSGLTVLHIAVWKGNLEIVKYLVDEKNGDFEAADESECTVLNKAALCRNLDVVRYLVDEKNVNFEAADESGGTVLHIAAKHGNLKLVEYLVNEKNANFEAADEYGRTVLHTAADNENWELVKYLVDEKNANFEVADKSGDTVLHKVAWYGKWKLFEYLVDKKNANFEAANESGDTVLHIAARYGNWKLFEYLVNEKNANFEAANKSGDTVLHIAARHENWKLVEYLVDEKNANFEAANKSGDTVLHITARHGNWKLFEYLVRMKSIMNK